MHRQYAERDFAKPTQNELEKIPDYAEQLCIWPEGIQTASNASGLAVVVVVAVWNLNEEETRRRVETSRNGSAMLEERAEGTNFICTGRPNMDISSRKFHEYTPALDLVITGHSSSKCRRDIRTLVIIIHPLTPIIHDFLCNFRILNIIRAPLHYSGEVHWSWILGKF